ncbi:MAG TPA: apolipoprotein N-acyltransferase, partial [Ramlibacter sp.]|nr:apolipoprotein N-acyltransferase [Ramlibacter sp.]
QAAAAFRSIETRLPQFRVTTNGHSGVIDASGSIVASAAMGERTLVIGEALVGEPPRTLVLAWGDWVGPTAAVFLALLAAAAVLRRSLRAPGAHAEPAGALPQHAFVLPPAARVAAGVLRALARAGLLGMAAAWVLGDSALQAKPLAQIRTFTLLVLAPELAAWLLLRAFRARMAIADGRLVFARGRQRLQVALDDIAAVQPWRLPLPSLGAFLRLKAGGRWSFGIALQDPLALARALNAPVDATRWTPWLAARAAVPSRRLAHPVAKFVLLPLLLAIPAFRLHQHIAYGGAFGEFHTFGLAAYLRAFALWWAGWAIGVALCAAVLRAVIEAASVIATLAQPTSAVAVRRWLEIAGLAALYAGLPAWLLLRLLAS